LSIAYVAAIGVVVALVLGNASAANDVAEVRTFAYYGDGKLAGWVRRDGRRQWWASNRRRGIIYEDLRGGYKLLMDGYRSPDAYAWPAKRGVLTRYRVALGPRSDTGWILVRITPTRWNIYYVIDFHGYSKRLEGFTKGPDGVAAELAFAQMDEDLLPH